MSDAKAPGARSPLRGRGRVQRVTVQEPSRADLVARLRQAATGGAAAELEQSLGSAIWLAPADAAAVGILGDVLRALEPPRPTAVLVPLAEGEVEVPRAVNADTLRTLVPVALDLIRALGLTPQARAALNIELVPGPDPTIQAGHAGYSEPVPLRPRPRK